MKGIHPAWRPVPSKAEIWTNACFAVMYGAIAVYGFAVHEDAAAWIWAICTVAWAGIVARSVYWRRKTLKAIADARALQEQIEREREAWEELIRDFHVDREEP